MVMLIAITVAIIFWAIVLVVCDPSMMSFERPRPIEIYA
jgi:hypothetical protein